MFFDVAYSPYTNKITYLRDNLNSNILDGDLTAMYTAFQYNNSDYINNKLTQTSLTITGTSVISNCTMIGAFITADDVEINNVTANKSTSLTLSGTSNLDNYFKNSSAINSTIGLTNDSKVDGCTFENITISGDSITLTRCKIIGNGETITFPTGYTATGKTFISGVSSNFEYELDCSVTPTIYDATGAADGAGLITIPAGLSWVGVFVFINDYPTISEIANLSTYCQSTKFMSNITDGGFIVQYYPLTASPVANTISRNWTDAAALTVAYDFITAFKGSIEIAKSGTLNNVIKEFAGF